MLDGRFFIVSYCAFISASPELCIVLFVGDCLSFTGAEHIPIVIHRIVSCDCAQISIWSLLADYILH